VKADRSCRAREINKTKEKDLGERRYRLTRELYQILGNNEGTEKAGDDEI